MSKKHGHVHIKLLEGQWYAFGSGQRKGMNLLLVPAINFCKKLNAAKVMK